MKHINFSKENDDEVNEFKIGDIVLQKAMFQIALKTFCD